MVASLKTRLLALQILAAIMAELPDSGPEAQAKCCKVCVVGGRGGDSHTQQAFVAAAFLNHSFEL